MFASFPPAALYGLSAAYGFGVARKCRANHREYPSSEPRDE